MGFFDALGKIAGEVLVAPISIVSGIVDGATDALDRVTDD